jgi:hypothetical protein
MAQWLISSGVMSKRNGAGVKKSAAAGSAWRKAENEGRRKSKRRSLNRKSK